MNNSINNNISDSNSQNIGNVNNGHNGIFVGDPHNVLNMGNNNIINGRAPGERNVTSKDDLSLRDLKNMELERKKFSKFIEDLKRLNPEAAKRIDFIMNHCAISQAELEKLNEFASVGEIEGRVRRVVTWIGEKGEIASKDGPAKKTSGMMWITKAANSFDLCVGARQLDKEEKIVDAEDKKESLNDAVKHFENLGFVIDKDEITKKVESLSKGKGNGFKIKIRPLMFNTFGVNSDSTHTQALRSAASALSSYDVSDTITEGAEVLRKYLEDEQKKADKEGVILIPYITGHSFGGFNATGIAAINGWGSTMFNPLGIGNGVANAKINDKDGKSCMLYEKLEELNKDSNKHLIFSTEYDFTSSNKAPYAGGVIANGGVFFGEVIDVPNKVKGEYGSSEEGFLSRGKKYGENFIDTHCNYKKNLYRNLRELESKGMNGGIGWDRKSFEGIFPDSDDGKGKNLQWENFGKFGEVRTYDEDKINKLIEKYNKTIDENRPTVLFKAAGTAASVAWLSSELYGLGLVSGLGIGATALVFGYQLGSRLIKENANPGEKIPLMRNTIKGIAFVNEKIGNIAGAGFNLAKEGVQKAFNAVGGQKVVKTVKNVKEFLKNPLRIDTDGMDLHIDETDLHISNSNIPGYGDLESDNEEGEQGDSETDDTSNHG